MTYDDETDADLFTPPAPPKMASPLPQTIRTVIAGLDEASEALRGFHVQRESGRPQSLREKALAQEVRRHEAKLERARQLLAQLEQMPTTDPWQDGQVLRAEYWFSSRQGPYTYILMRRGGLWYSTGRDGNRATLHRATWVELVDWFIAGRVEKVQELGVVSELWLSDQRAWAEAHHDVHTRINGWCERCGGTGSDDVAPHIDETVPGASAMRHHTG